MKAKTFRLKIRILSLILALLTVFYILPISAFAEAALPQNSENQVVSKSEQEKVNEVLAKREDLSSGRATVYTYDTAGRVTEIGEYDISDGNYYHGGTLVYNSDGRLSVSNYVLDYAYSSGVNYGTVRSNYLYNENGSLKTYDTRLSSRLDATYSYDALERLYQSNYQVSGGFKNTVTYEYRTSPHSSSYLSSFVSKYTSVVGRTSTTTTVYNYTYDERGNITGITVGGQQITYEYDDLGQLIRENNQPRGETYVYVYDNAGNLYVKRTYPYTTEQNPSSFTSVNIGTFGNSAWGDQLTAYKGVQITYDTIGNPLSYYNGTSYTFTWSGRQLKTAVKGGVNYSFEYDSDGLRTSKTVGGVKYTYYYADGKLLGQEWGANLIVFLYDESGMPIGMHYRTSGYSSGTWDAYWFERNLHGDVVAIYNNSNTKLASYIYDAWGNHTVTYHNGGGSLTAIVNNPIRYRGYYYDIDLGLYYLQTRYYDSNIGRFINADGVISGANGSLHGFNLYAYCFNNPVLLTDSSGGWPQWGDILRFVDDVVADVKAFDWENENEQSVLDSNYFSAYKKTLVVRTNLPRSGSFGIIFLTYESNDKDYPEDIVRHEYGHTKQLEQLGIINYALCIGIPSWQQWGEGKGYNKPWEIGADIYGDVQSRSYSSSSIKKAYDYLNLSKKIGVFVWLYIR